jgi:branched-chain amino acid transport system permease protein
MGGPDLLQAAVSGLLTGGIFALMAIGISLIWGVMDMIDFAYAEYLMWGMSLTFFLYAGLGLDAILSVPVNAVVLFGAGLLPYELITRRC